MVRVNDFGKVYDPRVHIDIPPDMKKRWDAPLRSNNHDQPKISETKQNQARCRGVLESKERCTRSVES